MAKSDQMIVVGATPPPVHGQSAMTERLLGSLRESGLLAAHLDTRDGRPLSTIGQFDLVNVLLGLKHAIQLIVLLMRHREARVYVPISQGRWGFVRDAVFLLIARLARRRRIVHLHGGYFATFRRGSGPILRTLIRASIGGVEQAWVLTEGLRSMFEGLVPAERIRVIANAVEDPRSSGPGGRSESPPDVLRVLYLANLLPDKGCFELVAALESNGALQSTELRLVGDGTAHVRAALEGHRQTLMRRGVALELPGAVAGSAKQAEYLAADMFVYPTRYAYEGQPLVVLEAMAAGLPIITTAIGGIPDTLVHGTDGLVVDSGDIDALAVAIRDLAADPERRRRIGHAARHSYLERHTPAQFRLTVENALTVSQAPTDAQRSDM